MTYVTLLGPQRLQPTLVQEVDRLAGDGPIVAITAGWQEREAEDGELREHLGREVVNLMLHRRCEEVFEEDQEFFRAHRERQDRLQALQRIYRYRLDFALEPARELLRREGPTDVLAHEQAAAIEALRKLDQDLLDRIEETHRLFEERCRPAERESVARHRREIDEILQGSAATAIAGGHVAVLLNRMRTFGLGERLRGRRIFAWSAGAMAISERVALFHDHPPQGMGNPEVLEIGLGLCPGIVPLPHARRRLRLRDPVRVEILARRFAPATCVPLDEGACVDFDGTSWSEALRLTSRGSVERGAVGPQEGAAS